MQASFYCSTSTKLGWHKFFQSLFGSTGDERSERNSGVIIFKLYEIEAAQRKLFIPYVATCIKCILKLFLDLLRIFAKEEEFDEKRGNWLLSIMRVYQCVAVCSYQKHITIFSNIRMSEWTLRSYQCDMLIQKTFHQNWQKPETMKILSADESSAGSYSINDPILATLSTYWQIQRIAVDFIQIFVILWIYEWSAFPYPSSSLLKWTF